MVYQLITNWYKVKLKIGVILLLLIVDSTVCTSAENERIIELKDSINIVNDSIKINLFSNLAIIYYYLDMDSCKVYTFKTFFLAQKNNNIIGIYRSYYCMMQYYLGNAEWDKAIEFGYKFIQFGRQNNLEEKLAYAYLSLGNAFNQIENYERALQYYRKAVAINDGLVSIAATANIGTYYMTHNLDSAENHFKMALTAYNQYDLKNINTLSNIATIYNNLGLIYYDRQYYTLAIEYLNKGLRIAEETNNFFNISRILINLGRVYSETAEYELAYKMISSGRHFADSLEIKPLILFGFRAMGEYYAEMGDFKNSQLYDTKYDQLRYELQGDKVQNKILEIYAEHTTYEKEREIEEIKKDKKRALRKYIIIIILSFFVFIAISIILYRRRKNKKIEEEKQKLLIEKEGIKRLGLIRLRILRDEDWAIFKDRFSETFPGFVVKMEKDFMYFTEGDKRQFMLIKLGCPNKESARILGISLQGVQRANQRLMKKMDLKNSAQLFEFIKRF